jgi:hypothetical protein
MLDIATSKVIQIIEYGHEIERAKPELLGFLETLNVDEQASLIAIMWVGRESFAPEDVQEAVETARREAITPTVDYLIGTPHFPDHLAAGLELLGLAEEDAL